MEKQEKKQLKDLLKKYLDSTPMDSNQSSSANNIINMLDDSSAKGPTKDGEQTEETVFPSAKGPTKDGEQTEETVFPSAEDYLTAVELYEKLNDSVNKLTSQDLSEELEEATNFLNYVTHMCAKNFSVDESELEDSKGNEDSDDVDDEEETPKEAEEKEVAEGLVNFYDLDIPEKSNVYDNLYDYGLEESFIEIDKNGNVLAYGLFPEDTAIFSETFNGSFGHKTSQEITDYLKEAYDAYHNRTSKNSYDEGYPIEDDLRNGRVFLKDMVVKFPPMGSEEEKEYALFQDFDNFIEPQNYHYYADGVKYIISKFPEKESFEILDKRFPLYDDEDKQLPFSISLNKMMVTGEKENFELNKLKYNDGECQYYSFENGGKLFIIYKCYDINEFYLSNTLNI